MGVVMKHKISILLMTAFLVGCANPNKAQKLDTKLDQSEVVTGSQRVGLKDGEMITLSKEQMAEKLRDLQNSVYSLEDKVYGTRKLGTLGLYGDYKSCRRKLASKQYGGNGDLAWAEPLDRVTDKEEQLKLGLDENKALVAVSQEYLRDRIQRFQGYRTILQKRSDEFEDKIQACKAELADKSLNTAESSKVLVREVPKGSMDKTAINKFMCEFVRTGAGLQSFMINAFARGWLSLSDFEMSQNLLSASLKDAKGDERANSFLFNGWKLAFDSGPATVGEVLAQSKDPKLAAWVFDHKADVPGAENCLRASDGVWNK
jgi:hypothetical protein